MIYSGLIKGENNKEISNATLKILTSTGDILTTIPVSSDGYWQIDSDQDSGLLEPGKIFSFCADGYSCYNIASNLIPSTFDVTLGKTMKALPYVIGGAGLALVAMALTKKKKGMGEVTPKQVTTYIYIGGAVIGFFLLKKLLEKLGIWKSAESTAVDQTQADPTSYWNVNFWQDQGGAPMSEDDATDKLWTINNAFTLIGDDESAIKQVFYSLTRQREVSYLAYVYQKNFGGNLLQFLRDGRGSMPWSGLSDSDIVDIDNYLKQLPK